MAKKKEAEEAGNGSMTKADAVRAAVQEGVTKPTEAVEWIKSKFDIDITPAHFSSYKSQQAKKEGVISSGGRKKETGGGIVDNGNPVELAKAVRALVQRHGAAAVKGMVEVFE
jgi:hypothetical protein